MLRFILACVLAVATLGHAADTSMVVGPDGKPAMAGRYWLVVFHSDGTAPTVSLALEVGGTVPIPPVPPTPPVDDVTVKIGGYIAAVTADPTKADTSAGLAMAYEQVLKLTIIKDAARLRMVAESLIDQALADPRVGKTATWKPFTDGMKVLTAPLDLAGVVNAYTIAQGLLGGGPVPPPTPPPPPPPVTSVIRAVIVEETSERTPEQAAVLTSPLLQTLRKSGKLLVLDKDATDSQGKPAAELSQYDGQPLPRVLGLAADGTRSAAAELPGTVDELLKMLADGGVK